MIRAVRTVAGIWANGSIVAQQSQLIGASRYNTTFDATQFQALLFRLEADLAASMIPKTGIGTDDLSMRIDLLRNQFAILRNGDLRPIIDGDPEAVAAVAALGTAVDDLASSLPQLHDTAVALDHLTRLRRLNGAIARMVSLVDEEAGDLVHRYQVRLSDTYEGMFALLLGLVASGLMLVGLLLWRAVDATRVARTDALTGLPNRRAFFEDLAAVEWAPGATTSALVMLDLDGFRGLSEHLGNEMADQLLRAVAQRLAREMPKGAQIARIGDDEFAIAIHGADAASLVAAMVARFDEAAGRPIDIGPLSLRVTSSMGIAIEAGTPPLELLRYAELALDEARAGGHGLHRYFTTALAETHRRRKAIEAEVTTTVEGIESEEQLARVIAIGCDQGQGYLFARPLPAHDFLRFLSVARIAGMPDGPGETAVVRAA